MSGGGWRLGDFLARSDSVSGKVFGQYEVLNLIKEGGMGLVYGARDIRLDRRVALKFLPFWASGHARSRQRMREEAKLASSLSHRCIVAIYELAEEQGFEFIVMEYVVGDQLNRVIPRNGLPMPKALRYAVQLADALAFAHSRGVVHRDLKLSNIIVGPDGRVTLLDFGLAARLGAPVEHDGFGTSMWLAPEEQGNRLVFPDPRSEIFSFGVLLHQMLSGRHPFGPGAPAAVADAIRRRPPLALPAYTSGRLISIVERCLAKEPAQRYESMKEVLGALEDCCEACGVRAGGPFGRLRR